MTVETVTNAEKIRDSVVLWARENGHIWRDRVAAERNVKPEDCLGIIVEDIHSARGNVAQVLRHENGVTRLSWGKGEMDYCRGERPTSISLIIASKQYLTDREKQMLIEYFPYLEEDLRRK